ncbi:hypothetical protein M2093_001148 [Breznakia sp. PH1-1]|nr:hypothetical protein [Breznakia sp. PH1-1]MDH6404228.1 hypothetical protein [Breznakia sp. PF1-11]MDH6411887.1 hypothetical protein [Breznakia sp. PFB1-11]MDH6414216.1 hypothetical protein [Breznakia sp. PFB1-14]MDH6415960.1 hypothetical protein [Breznakia sp. PFB1-4]MDH6418969.1 hypothetical protein [Breznakia sp. PFB1-12]MDH6473451.1 hypothetical protein [Breznakia sp. PFB2-30]MDH6475887.1 hypothetical protein [Breznakia sp. PFB1-19]
MTRIGILYGCCYTEVMKTQNQLNKICIFSESHEFLWENFLRRNPALKIDLDTNIKTCYPSSYYVNGVEYHIPYRIGYEVKKLKHSNTHEKVIAYCPMSRHHNGFVREKYLKKVLKKKYFQQYSFVSAYVLRLIGEYVEEIWDVVYEHKHLFDNETTRLFIYENNQFIDKMFQRSYSYFSNNRFGKPLKKRYLMNPLICKGPLLNESSNYKLLSYVVNLKQEIYREDI